MRSRSSALLKADAAWGRASDVTVDKMDMTLDLMVLFGVSTATWKNYVLF